MSKRSMPQSRAKTAYELLEEIRQLILENPLRSITSQTRAHARVRAAHICRFMRKHQQQLQHTKV